MYKLKLVRPSDAGIPPQLSCLTLSLGIGVVDEGIKRQLSLGSIVAGNGFCTVADRALVETLPPDQTTLVITNDCDFDTIVAVTVLQLRLDGYASEKLSKIIASVSDQECLVKYSTSYWPIVTDKIRAVRHYLIFGRVPDYIKL